MSNDEQTLKFDLFQGGKVCLAPIDMESDPEVLSRWSHDSTFLRLMEIGLARPITPAQVKKELEEMEKESDKSGNLYFFTIRSLEDDRLLGTAKIEWIEWSTQSAWMNLGIGSAEDRSKGYGGEAMRLLLRFAFHELNLYRLGARLPTYNQGAQRFIRRFGFTEDARLREAVHRYGRYWDLLLYGLLRDEWQRSSRKQDGTTNE